jgi:hypothetical protein
VKGQYDGESLTVEGILLQMRHYHSRGMRGI